MTRVLALLILLLGAGRLSAAPTSQPAALEGIGVDQRLGERVPLDLRFVDEAGKTVELRDFFHGRPVLLTLVYYECPSLCTTSLTQLTRGLNGLSESAGERFDIVTVSINPRETPALAAAKKANYLHSYRRPSAADGWHFLTGRQESIDALAQAVGFRYRWDPAQQAYAHASALMVVAPDGTLSRYFLGVDFPPTELRAAIDEASAGRVGPPAEAIYFYCFKYDPTSGRYTLIIGRALRVLGAACVVGIVGLVASLQLITARRRRAEGAT